MFDENDNLNENIDLINNSDFDLDKIDKNAPLIEKDLLIDKRITNRSLTIVVSSILYFIIISISLKSGVHDIQTKFINNFISTIMYSCYGVSIIIVAFGILYYCSKRFYAYIYNLKVKVKKLIFDILDWISIFAICAALASFCFAFLFAVAEVDGTSMQPNYSQDDRVFVSYLEKVDRFDVVVAYINEEDNILDPRFLDLSTYPVYYIKRVIGLPGDRVTWDGGYLRINGELIDEYYFDEETILSHRTFPGPNSSTFKYGNMDEVKYTEVIPEGYYFVLGDNRRVSVDSRTIGLIKEENIEGVVKFKFTSLFK